jgi:hypothetical protein
MGLALLTYSLLALTGSWLFYTRQTARSRPDWLRLLHVILGTGLVVLVLLLLGIGIVGTLGHYGDLGHSAHLPAGIAVVSLVLLSAGSATQIQQKRPWARPLHIGLNVLLFAGFAIVAFTGWSVVQKYLP